MQTLLTTEGAGFIGSNLVHYAARSCSGPDRVGDKSSDVILNLAAETHAGRSIDLMPDAILVWPALRAPAESHTL